MRNKIHGGAYREAVDSAVPTGLGILFSMNPGTEVPG
jgi:hypothetical protein